MKLSIHIILIIIRFLHNGVIITIILILMEHKGINQRTIMEHIVLPKHKTIMEVINQIIKVITIVIITIILQVIIIILTTNNSTMKSHNLNSSSIPNIISITKEDNRLIFLNHHICSLSNNIWMLMFLNKLKLIIYLELNSHNSNLQNYK